MGLTFNLELNSKPNAQGLYTVLIRIHRQGEKPARVKTSVSIPGKKYWAGKPAGKWIKGLDKKDALNAVLKNELDEIEQIARGLQQQDIEIRGNGLITPKAVAEQAKTAGGDNYFELLERAIERNKRTRAPGTLDNWKYHVELLKEFAGDDLKVGSVGSGLIRRFQMYLQGKKNNRGNYYREGTINVTLASLASMHVDILMQCGMSKRQAQKQSPYSNIDKLTQTDNSKKLRLREQDIEAVRVLEIKRGKSNGLPVREAFSVWLLSYFLGGMRVSDVLLLKYNEFETSNGLPVLVRYQQYKTDNYIVTEIMPEALDILNRWWKLNAPENAFVLPFLDNKEAYAKYTRKSINDAPYEVKLKLRRDIIVATQRINAGLKLIDADLTMHTARHSVADLARRIMEKEGGIGLADIQKMLGHSDLKNTKSYIEKISGQDTSKVLKTIFSKK